MKFNKTILIITDRFHKSGNGNYLRSYTLYTYLKKYFLCKFILFNNLKKIFINKYDIIILDLPFKKYNINSLKKFKGKIIGLDHHLKFNIYLNISLFRKSNYAEKNLCSLKFTIIRDEIKKNKNKIVPNLIFISIGSADIKNIRFKVINSIKKRFSNIFLSKKFKHQSQIAKFKNTEFIKNMQSCFLGITNGGTTMLEMIYLKKMIIAFPQTLVEKQFINYVKKNYKVYSGFDMLKRNMLNKIIKQKQVSGPIDGNGCKYIMIEIRKIINNAKYKKL